MTAFPCFQNDFLGSDSSTLDEIHEEDEEEGEADGGEGDDGSITTSDLMPRGTNLEPALNIPILPHLDKYSIIINKTSKQSLGTYKKKKGLLVFLPKVSNRETVTALDFVPPRRPAA